MLPWDNDDVFKRIHVCVIVIVIVGNNEMPKRLPASKCNETEVSRRGGACDRDRDRERERDIGSLLRQYVPNGHHEQ